MSSSESEPEFLSEDSGSDFDLDEPKAKKKASPKKKAPVEKKPPKAPGSPKKAAPKKAAKQNGGPSTSNGTAAKGKVKDEDDDDMDVFTNIDNLSKKNRDSMTIEKIYQKKTQLEHILLRPDTYIGSVEYCDKTPMWVYDQEKDKIVERQITYVPGLYKIFDEILVNAADNKQRDPKMNLIKIDINKEKNRISVYNNGRGIPVVEHKVEQMFVPEMIFGTLLTSSNYNDDERKVTGGRNGYGAKLCNIFSKRFTVETSDRSHKKQFKQTWVNNMNKDAEPEITSAAMDDFTKVTFEPDLKKFKMSELDDDIIALMSRRAYDIAGTSPGVRVFLNGKQLPCKTFKEYIEQYTNDNVDHTGEPYKVIYEKVGARWEVAVTVSEKGFQQVSFVNSIATTKGGRHVDYVTDQITTKLIELIKKKVGKGGVNVRAPQIKNQMWVFVNCLIENPTFDSQTKENMTLQPKNFGSTCDLSEKFTKDVQKCGIVEQVMSWVKFKQQEQADKKCSSRKTQKLKGIPKLEDANDAGTKNSHMCTLILTEGDSAKTLAVSGLGVIGRDRYGVFPLRGKMLNVREASHKQIMDNAEITAMLKIVGLQYKVKYEDDEQMKTLRYGKIMIMADQDQDGSHIKGLVINFIHANWPNLMKRNFVEEFITPIVKATKGKDEISFFSIPEYIEWRQNTDNWKSWKIKYYKGLGTSTSKEAKEYFSDMARHRIKFKYAGDEDDKAVELAFSKKKIEERKGWLTNWMETRKARRAEGQMEDYLYGKDTRAVTYAEFINKELVLFSNMDNERSIPSLVDGLKPGQRKVLFTCFKRADKKEVKVAQLAGAVGEMSAYHHGEQSLMMTIVNLAQDFVGSNNINVLLPIGQFGTRLQGGKDSASPRYIFTQLSPVTRTLFPKHDENVLRFLFEENQRIEPEWYCPIIPMVLVNGAEGIGTGWSTKVPNYNPRDIVKNIRRLVRGEEMQPMVPWYKHFRGSIVQLDDSRCVCSGEVGIVSEDTIEITELPVKMWTQNYKENVIEPMLEGTEGKPALITDFKEYHTDATVKFLVKMTPDKLRAAEAEGLHKVFKLQNVIHTSSMVLFDAAGCLRRFNSPEEVCREFFEARKNIYIERKRFLEGMLSAESMRLSEQARFILMKIKGEIHIENKRKAAIIEQLQAHKFKPDPVKVWREIQKKKELEMCGEVDASEDEDEEEGRETGALEKKVSDYDYLVGMAMWKLSMEDKDKMLAESEKKKVELRTLESKEWSDLWEEDLADFMAALEKQENKETKDLEETLKKAAVKLSKDNTGGGRNKAKHFDDKMKEVKPNPHALRVAPTLDHMKAKYEEKPKRVKKEPKKEGGDIRGYLNSANGDDSNGVNDSNDGFFGNENGEDFDLKENKPDKKKLDAATKTKTVAKKPAAEKETKPKAAKKTVAKSSPKKAAKPKKGSDDESEDDDVMEIDEDSDMDVKPAVPREGAPRRAAAAAAKKYVLDDDDDDSGSDVMVPSKKKRVIADSDDEDF